jgi:aminoglycoside phosphotransferase (APT) family kinase protein
VLRTDAPTGIASSLGRMEEFAVLRAAFAADVMAPEPLFACADPAVIGQPFFVMRHISGTAQGRQITTDPALEGALPLIAYRLGQELARLQRVRPPRADLDFLPMVGAAEHIAQFRAYLDRHPNPRPVLEWAIRWLETHPPASLPPVLCHRDFRTGNYMLDGTDLTGTLDWEFAGWGDPDEDIGWFCCKGWRFARLDREAGGIAARTPFYDGYESVARRRPEPERVRFWEVLANVRWAVIALQQSDRHLQGGARDLSTAIIGRRATECDLELLLLLDPVGTPDRRTPARLPGERVAVRHVWRDLPSGAGLLALGREWLLAELLPLLPPERERELRLVATAMAIAEREAAAGDRPLHEIADQLRSLRPQTDARPASAAPHPDPLPASGERESGEPPEPLAPRAGRGRGTCGASEGEGVDRQLRRLAADLRAGAFEPCETRARAARAVLWQLTVFKLREGNPQFLAANGFGE